jgi:uncharacterized protein YjiK
MNNDIDLNNPLKVIELPDKLKEISGITFYKEGQLLCHHDENSGIYIIDYQTSKVDKLNNEVIKGDFEDIVFMNGLIYMLQSNGRIFEYRQQTGNTSKPEEYTTGLDEMNNCEGLAYDKQTNSLLIACKEKSTLKGSAEAPGYRSIYRFDLETKKLMSQPIITISLIELENNYGIKKFKPSGIAIEPKTKNYYILASAGKSLLIINKAGEIIKACKLNPDIFEQPEGICFDPEGKLLFISSEGKNNKAKLFIFKME